MASYQFLQYKDCRFAYIDNQRSSDQVYIAFHGYADSAMQFESLLNMSKSCRFIAIELPYHGQSSSCEDMIKPEDLYHVICQILEGTSATHWHLIGFSMGARIIGGLLPFIPCQIGKVLLISPAGFSYSLSLSTWFFPLFARRFFGRWMLEGKTLLTFWTFLYRVNALSEQTYHIFVRQVKSERKRKRMMYIWLMMYHFCNKFKSKHWDYLDKSEKVILLCGSDDQVTPSKKMYREVKHRSNVHFHQMKGDHFLLVKKGEEIRQFLEQNEYL